VSGDGLQVKPPRVLISYSHESEEHRARVLALAQRLRKDGVDARLDRFVPPPPEGWSHWMEGQLKEADRIIVVCAPTYSARASRDAAAGVGLGVSWEWHLVRKEVYETRGEASRIVPVFFDGVGKASVPAEVWDRPRHDAASEAGYLSLLDDLFGRAEITPQPVGVARTRPVALSSAPVLSAGAPATSTTPTSPASSPSPNPTPPSGVRKEVALEKLLLRLFSISELRRYVADLPDGDELRNELPAGGSPAEFSHAFVDALKRRGGVDAAFFGALQAERPRRSADIDLVRRSWGA
jgi:hypothetical protein